MKSPGVDLGKVKGSLFKREILTEEEINHHVHVVGASGFGKTVLLSHIIKNRIEAGKGMLYIDLKGDIETIENLLSVVRGVSRESDVKIFSLTDLAISTAYNPIFEGTANQIRDRIMLSLNWSEEYYKNQTASYLLKLLIGLCHLRFVQHKSFDLHTLYRACSDSDYVEELAMNISASHMREKMLMEECLVFLRNAEFNKCLQGLRSQLESLLLSDFGELLRESKDGINLFEAVTSGKLIFVLLDSRRYGESAKTVARLILQDLKAASSKVDAEVPKERRIPFSCIIDEFADFATEDFVGFLDRARSSKMSVVIAHQEISDLKRISPEFAARLMGNMSTLYAFLQKGPESAELISSMGGTRKAWKETQKSSRIWLFDVPTGEKSLREVEEFNVHPNTIKNLRVGECVVIKKYPLARAYQVFVRLC